MSIPKPKITPAFKKKAQNDWHAQISTLTIRSKHMNLSRIVGPLMITIAFDIKSDKEKYWPEFCCHNLSETEEHIYCILSKGLRKEFIHPDGRVTGYDESFTVRAHESGAYIDAAQRMKEQALLPLEGPISVSRIWQAYKDYLEKKKGPFTIPLIQDPALIAAWAGREDLAQQYLDWSYKYYKNWHETTERLKKDDNPEAWLKMMQEKINNPEELRRISAEEIIKHKLEYLPQEELIPE